MKRPETYRPLPLTAAQAAEVQDFTLPPACIDVQAAIERADGPREKLRQALEGRNRIAAVIADEQSAARQTLLHNACLLPLISQIQEYSDQCRKTLPHETLPFEWARKTVTEILYAAIKKRTGKNHRPMNNISGYEDEVQFVTECILNAEGQGHETHGLIRVARYVDAILHGLLKPYSKVALYEEAPGIARFDGKGTFGQVAVQIAVQHLLEKLAQSRQQTMTVTAFNMGHAGRLEFLLRQIVRAGHQGFALFNVQGWGRTTFEPDGVEGLWGTNPTGFGNSTGVGENGNVGDCATTARPEGFVSVSQQNNLMLPFDVLRTPDGKPTIDPNDLYATEKPAILLPIGGDIAAYKGAMLGQTIDVFVDAMNGRTPKNGETMLGSNSMVLYAAKPGDSTYWHVRERLEHFRRCKTASGHPVRMPGEEGLLRLYKAQHSGLPVAKNTWQQIEDLHRQLCK